MTHHSRATPCPQVCHGHGPPPALPPTQESPSRPLGCSGSTVITSSPVWGAETAPRGTGGQDTSHGLGRALSPRHRMESRDESSRYPKDVSEPSAVCLAGEW